MKSVPLDSAAVRPEAARPERTSRIDSVDWIRGVVMVLMAIDHVPVYAGVPAGGVTTSRWSLPLLYLVFAIDVAFLYPLCRWFAALKARSRARWLRYV